MPKKLIIPGDDFWDPVNEKFLKGKDTTLILEHSLLSLSKWEQKWKISFLDTLNKKKMTGEQFMDYIRCMCITPPADPDIFKSLPPSVVQEIVSYIEDPMSATTITEPPGPKKQGHIKVITSEVIYYWMSALQIPFDPCEKWHLNRLMTLIKIASIEQQPDKKMSRKEALAQQRSLNAARRARTGSKG